MSIGIKFPEHLNPATKPIFIKANFTFSVMGQTYSFVNQSLSAFGISGLRWSHFDPAQIVGLEVQVAVDVLATPRMKFTTKGFFMAEETGTANYIGIQFVFDLNVQRELTAIIEREGFYPTQQIRKFPRIPALADLPSMPLHVIATHENGELISFDISNMSPTGLLMRSENPRAGFLLPRSRVRLQLEPRGQAVLPCKIDAVICRAFYMKNQKTGNIIRSFGVRFVKISEEDKANFLELLRIVLDNLQNVRK